MLRSRKFFLRATDVPTSSGTTLSRDDQDRVVVHKARVVSNRALCREHYLLTCCVPEFAPAQPGQFVHLSPHMESIAADRPCRERVETLGDDWIATRDAPLLRRAFSIAGLLREPDGVQIEVIYRVVGKSTGWLESLSVDAPLSLLGPLGNAFPIRKQKGVAWLVCGGVGLPPMLWLAEALRKAERSTVAFCGARSSDLLALTMDSGDAPDVDALEATFSCEEFVRHQVPVVISTDDGSLGFHGHIAAALAAYADAKPKSPDEIVVYTCGPEIMMRGVADLCRERGIECHACMERSMACGTGLCQSCVVPVHDDSDAEGWRYQLCCTDGPVFDAAQIKWD